MANRNRIIIIILVNLIVLAGFAPKLLTQTSQNKGIGHFGELTVLSIRKMNLEERSRMAPDYIGATYIIRLRLEVTGKYSVSVYAPYCGKPVGHLLVRKNGEVRWWAITGDTNTPESPGFEALDPGIGDCWLLMHPGSAYEWEIISEPVVNKEEARSIFIKTKEDKEPFEIISPWYDTEEPEESHNILPQKESLSPNF